MTLSVVVPSLNGKELLEDSLPYLFASLKNISSYEVIVVDNGSSDNTVTYIREEYPTIHLLTLAQNVGFTGAVNAGVKQAKGSYVLILNNDCHLQQDTIKKLLKYMRDNPDHVATQPIVLNLEQDVENIGFIVDLKHARAHPVAEPSHIPGKLTDLSTFVYGLSGTCFLIQKEVFEDIGMFDESFHSYLEDVDLSMRLVRKYTYGPTLKAAVVHHHMATSRTMGSYKQKQDIKNWIRIILKNYSFLWIVQYAPWLFIERLRNLHGLLKKYYNG